MMACHKKASITTEEAIKLILGAAVVLILGLLIYQLISPVFDRDDETAKSYFETLKKAIERADSGGDGQFFIWENKRAFLVYFGDYSHRYYIEPGYESDDDSSRHYFFGGITKNSICVCVDACGGNDEKECTKGDYVEEGNKKYKPTNCDYCMSLKFPAELKGVSAEDNEVPWVVRRGDRLEVRKDPDTGNYLFIGERLDTKDFIDYMYIFKGKEYWKYQNQADYIPKGYPADIVSNWSINPEDLPTGKIDAAFNYNDKTYYLFSGDKYWEHYKDGSVWKTSISKNTKTGWEGVLEKLGTITAAAAGAANKIYFFSDTMVCEYYFGKDPNGGKDEDKIGSCYSLNSPGWEIPEGTKITAASYWKDKDGERYIYLFSETEYWKYWLEVKESPKYKPYDSSTGVAYGGGVPEVIGYNINYKIKLQDGYPKGISDKWKDVFVGLDAAAWGVH